MKFKLIEKRTLMMTIDVGTATDKDGKEIQLMSSVPIQAPIVEFNGRRAILTWDEMIPAAMKLLDPEPSL